MIRRGRIDRRPGFTLIELLVVLALMILLLALAVGVAQSDAFGSQKVISAADRASQWLLIAKQRAMRDGAPRGVRFLRNSVNPNGITEAQYIEAPDPWVPNPNNDNTNGPWIVFVYRTHVTPATSSTPSFTNVPPQWPYRQAFFVGNQVQITDFEQRVSQLGTDYLVIPELGQQHRISTWQVPANPTPLTLYNNTVQVGTAGPLFARELMLVTYPDMGLANSGQMTPDPPSSPPPTGQACKMTTAFAFQTGARPLLGEPMLQLAGNTVIDWRDTVAGTAPILNPFFAPPNNAAQMPPTTIGVLMEPGAAGTPNYAYFDILFSPSGQVMYNSNSMICLWVHDPDKAPHPRQDPNAPGTPNDFAGYNAAGEQSLVTVYVRSGLIATHPVAPPPPPPSTGYDPYQFARDGMNSGL